MTRSTEDSHQDGGGTDKAHSPRCLDTTGITMPRGDTAMVAPSVCSNDNYLSDEYSSAVVTNHHAGQQRLLSRAIPVLPCTPMTRGSGDRRCWKPSTKRIIGHDGNTTTRYSRVTFYVRDVGPKTGKMVQQKISFKKTTNSSKTTRNSDTRQGDLGNFPTAIVGQ